MNYRLEIKAYLVKVARPVAANALAAAHVEKGNAVLAKFGRLFVEAPRGRHVTGRLAEQIVENRRLAGIVES